MDLLKKLIASKEATKTLLDLRPQVREIFFDEFTNYDEWYADRLRRVKHNTPQSKIDSMGPERFANAARGVINRIENLRFDKAHACGSTISLIVDADSETRQCLGCNEVSDGKDGKLWKS